jgi:hypothetical protein
MKIYRVFTNKKPECMFPDAVIRRVNVLAYDEQEAIKTVLNEYKEQFACEDNELEIELIGCCLFPFVISVEYYCNRDY